jgi:hypothetical protein
MTTSTTLPNRLTSVLAILASYKMTYEMFATPYARPFPSVTLPSIDLQRFRDELEQLYLTKGYPHQQLAFWLVDRGLIVASELLSGGLKIGASHDEGLPEYPPLSKRFPTSSTLPSPTTIPSPIPSQPRVRQSQHNRSNELA